ncbi:RNA-binding KH domain-containing protein RCF3 [Rosa rugosa]|uniref:RNA-binding KH domain-containing protein RCF3 n=1 Tax=Rosa rugosa TaxID=74645 RepID=UPI002B4011C9|nr:RNA-binding KH domain-containing protein RCF3 [Rosa rugosa]
MEPQSAESSTTALFRLLFPSSKAGSLIGKLGSVPGAKVQFDYPTHGDECVVVILADPNPQSPDGSPAQQALVRVFKRMVDELGQPENGNGSVCCCRLLIGSGQAGCVLGRGGKVVEKMRQDSGAQVRVFPRDQIPPCASAGDELIQITGDFSAVKKALLSVSGCLLDNAKVDATNSSATKVSGGSIHGTGMPAQVDSVPHRGFVSSFNAVDYQSRSYSSNSAPDNSSQRMAMEEEVVFKLLCQHDKVGSLIGKGGSIIRTFQSETGASIKIVDAAPDSDERVVVISAQENPEQNYSPAQEAVMRVHHRIAEIGFEPGAAVVARLLLHPQQIGCLLGKGGFIINEMRRATGASIRIFPKEQVQKSAYHHDDVVQVIGSLQSVQDALFHITSRIREAIFPMKQSYPNFGVPPYMSSFPEMPPPSFRPRHNSTSPGAYPSPVGFHHGMDHSAFRSQPPDHQSPFSHGDHSGLSHMDRVPYSYGGERPGHGPAFERSSPRAWTPQGVSSGNLREIGDANLGLAPRSGSLRSGCQPPQLTSTTIEIMIPQAFMTHVYGENNSNLNQIRQISGANLVVHDSKPGSLETQVVVSGSPDKTHAAQSLIHGFILCGQTQV